MCGLVWSTLYLGYLPDRYIIILLLRLPYVARLTKHIVRPFYLSESRLCLYDWSNECPSCLLIELSIVFGISWIRSIYDMFVHLWTDKYRSFIYSLIQFCDFNFRQYASQGQRYRRVQRRKALQPQQQERERQEEGHQWDEVCQP